MVSSIISDSYQEVLNGGRRSLKCCLILLHDLNTVNLFGKRSRLPSKKRVGRRLLWTGCRKIDSFVRESLRMYGISSRKTRTYKLATIAPNEFMYFQLPLHGRPARISPFQTESLCPPEQPLGLQLILPITTEKKFPESTHLQSISVF